ncbi:MAG: hypothetical protein ABUT20_12760 [Bacteroidota bacterium]
METSHSKQIAIGLIDASIALASILLLTFNKFPKVLYDLVTTYNTSLLILLWFALYRLVCIILFKRTIGMKIFSVKLMTESLQAPSLLESFLASFFVLINGIRYCDIRQ